MELAVIFPILLILPIVTWVDCSHEHDVSDVEARLMMADEDTLTESEKERLWKFQYRVESCIFAKRITPPLWPTGDLPFWLIDPHRWMNEDDAEYQYAGSQSKRKTPAVAGVALAGLECQTYPDLHRLRPAG